MSDAIEELCQRALALTPTERYRDANEMLAALRRLRSVTRPASRRGGPVSSPTPTESAPSTTTAPLSSSGPRSPRAPTPPTPPPLAARALAADPRTRLLALAGLVTVLASVVVLVSLTRKKNHALAAPDPSASRIAADPRPTPRASASAAASAASAASAEAPSKPGAPQLRLVGGTFTMGTPDGSEDERPREVTVAPFLLDQREVTAEDYDACVKASACLPTKTYAKCTRGHPAKRSHPINCVTWAEADSYCLWAGKRLPTEAEWEFAARGKEGRKYPWGDDEPQRRACWSSDLTCEAGALPEDQTPEKILDLGGNVAEWTASAFCPGGGHCMSERKVVRGGHFGAQQPGQLRGGRRGAEDARFHAAILGFRCAADAPAGGAP